MSRSSALYAVAWLAAPFAGAAACTLDERTLTPVSISVTSAGTGSQGGKAGAAGGAGLAGAGAGSGGATAGSGGSLDPGAAGGGVGGTLGGKGGSSGAGRGGAGGTGGSGDGSGDGGEPGERCFDLNDNGVLDCDETLVANGTFDMDAEGWAVENNAKAVWDEEDAAHHSESGSLVVSNTTDADAEGEGLTAASQCVRVTGGDTYDVIAMARVAKADSAGKGVLNVWYFASDDCSGNVRGGFTSGAATTHDRWSQVRVISGAPTNAGSMLVRLAVQKPFRDPSAQVHFDDLLVKGL